MGVINEKIAKNEKHKNHAEFIVSPANRNTFKLPAKKRGEE